MTKQKGGAGDKPVIVIRREEAGEEGHHGGAWKIAYADFVTAMMAFFLLMWLINATTDAQRRGLADYFAPTNILGRSASGSGEPFGGRTINSSRDLAGESSPAAGLQNGQPFAPQQARENDDDSDPEEASPPPAARLRYPVAQASQTTAQTHSASKAAADARGGGGASGQSDTASSQEAVTRAQSARAVLMQAAEEIRTSVGSDPQLADLARQLILDQVPEGLRIQIVDADRQPVFAAGQAAPNSRGRALLLRVAGVIARLPNAVEIAGHTDGTPFKGGSDRSNWDLSSDRASATRRLLVDAGVSEDRVRAVAGRADRELLVPQHPTDAANRRTSILVVMPNDRTGGAGAGGTAR
ncbi:OmpA family protein [Roseomonas sp. SSH11]|uniref:OmpA family protein n=1 Tax=Pararoseomonas baculiformis TaxID=2820812 RepID=A0ABS4ALG5_9PROT|nr:flagellar motor protein MotB [Pararoseomonas baculiformis]MBP0447858.1 OmpA family protein [Pararoseomonas baculiformis]